MPQNRLLIIDDELMIRKMLSKYLFQEGYQIITAENGKDGLEQFYKHLPQVVLLDLKMPVMGGVEFLKNLKPVPDHTHAVIILTGHNTDEDVELCYKLGVQVFLKKPVSIYEIRGLVKNTIFQIQSAHALKKEMAARKQAHQLLKSTLDGMNQGVVSLDDNFMIQMISLKACNMLGITETEALNKPAASMLGTSIAGPSGLLIECFRKKSGLRDEQTTVITPRKPSFSAQISIEMLDQASSSIRWLVFLQETPDLQRLHEGRHTAFGRMVSCSPRMKDMFQLIQDIAPSNATVLIQGASGTGKELVALEIHDRSRRASRPFHAVNCAAIPGTLLESEFFGHEKGSFTGADQAKPGRFELANGGTLFLDEIGDIPLELQVKLLRALQEQKFERVGGTRSIKVDVRIIAATNKDLRQLVENQEFREDLFYRLDVISIKLPTLHERPEDISLLVTEFLERLNRVEHRTVKGIAPDVLQVLIQYSWPGNVRELYHVIEYAFAVSKGDIIQMAHMPEKLRTISPPQTFQTEKTAPKSEKEAIMHALEQANYRKGKAAALLGISVMTLYRKRLKYGL
ncbi:MAG: sigma 54-interacting transcriptional regulator [SAR324 cluster bacterium]|nr:sigma 54-interacting transcriptional regulator [SAR324 cluster bacterium]